MNTTDTTEIMGINRATLAEVELDAADYYVLAGVTYDEDGQYVSHNCFADEYATYAEAVAGLCNTYTGDNIWQDVIYPLADEALTDAIDNGRSDRFGLEDGTVIEFDPQRGEWVAR